MADDGPGVPEADRERIFDPFFTTKEPGEGTGLGLAIVAAVARTHRATVTIAERPGGGTRVRVVFPGR